MLRVLGTPLLTSIANLAIISDALEKLKISGGNDAQLRPHIVDVVQFSASHLMELGMALNMPAVKGAAERCLLAVKETGARIRAGAAAQFNELNSLSLSCQQLVAAATDEFGARIMFVLPPASTELVADDSATFGNAVADAFPLASEDISEAAQCLGLGRYTASVFHLMRAMESAVQVLAATLGVTNVEREWGKLLSDIGKTVEAMAKGPSRDRWSESHSHLYHVKQAWRNDTMHPKKTYTAEEAHAVYRAVKSFMVHLAPLVEASRTDAFG